MSQHKHLPPRDMNELASKVDFIHFLQQEGYALDPNKGLNGKTVVLKKDDETLLINRAAKSGNAMDMYLNANDGRDKGNVFHFLRNRGYEWRDTFDKVDRYLGNVPANYQEARLDMLIKPLKKSEERNHEQELMRIREGIVKHSMELLPLTDTTYLERRGLSKQTLTAPEFKDRIFNTNKDFEGKTYTNTEFPLRNEHGITNAIIRNEKFNGFHAFPKYGGAWISQTKHQAGPVDALIITESPIDSLSYHQLKQPSAKGQKVVHFATGGRLDPEQAKFLQAVINNTRTQGLVLANDHDTAGIRQNINIIGAVYQPDNEASKKITARLDNPERLHRVLTITAIHDSPQERERWDSQMQHLEKTLNKDDIEGLESTASLKSTKESTHLTEYELEYKGGSQKDKKVQRAIIQMKEMEAFIKVELPLEKDYNDQLQQQNHKKQYYHLEIVGENSDRTRRFQKGFETKGEALYAFMQAHETYRNHTHYIALQGLVPNEKGKTGEKMEQIGVSYFDDQKNKRLGEIDEDFDDAATKQLKNNPELEVKPSFPTPAPATAIERDLSYLDIPTKDSSREDLKDPAEQSKPTNEKGKGMGLEM